MDSGGPLFSRVISKKLAFSFKICPRIVHHRGKLRRFCVPNFAFVGRNWVKIVRFGWAGWGFFLGGGGGARFPTARGEIMISGQEGSQPLGCSRFCCFLMGIRHIPNYMNQLGYVGYVGSRGRAQSKARFPTPKGCNLRGILTAGVWSALIGVRCCGVVRHLSPSAILRPGMRERSVVPPQVASIESMSAPSGRVHVGKNRWSSPEGLSARAEQFGPGPQSLRELFEWPQAAIRGLSYEDRLRLKALSADRAIVYSDYSGCDCFREALSAAWRELAKGPEQIPADAFTWRRACDYAPACQRILCAMSKLNDGGNSCVLNDINDRLAPSARAVLDAMTPTKPDRRSPAQVSHAKEAYKNMERWLVENRSWCFSGASWCLMHKQMCPAHPSDVTTEGAEEPPPKSAKSSSSVSGGRRRPLYINCAGVTCVAWSTVGSKLQHAHASERAHAIWVAERIRNAVLRIGDITSESVFRLIPS